MLWAKKVLCFTAGSVCMRNHEMIRLWSSFTRLCILSEIFVYWIMMIQFCILFTVLGSLLPQPLLVSKRLEQYWGTLGLRRRLQEAKFSLTPCFYIHLFLFSPPTQAIELRVCPYQVGLWNLVIFLHLTALESWILGSVLSDNRS